MSNRSQSFDLTTTDPNIVIEVKVRYSKPDNSYFNDRAEESGYWVNFTPVKIEGMFRVTTAYTGIKALVEPAKRFGAKKLENLFSEVKHSVMTGHTEDRWPQLARRIASENDLRITQWDEGIKARMEANKAIEENPIVPE